MYFSLTVVLRRFLCVGCCAYNHQGLYNRKYYYYIIIIYKMETFTLFHIRQDILGCLGYGI